MASTHLTREQTGTQKKRLFLGDDTFGLMRDFLLGSCRSRRLRMENADSGRTGSGTQGENCQIKPVLYWCAERTTSMLTFNNV